MAVITHKNVEALMDEQISREIIEGVVKDSKALQVMTRLENMTSNKLKVKVTDMLPVGYWVDETTNNGRKQTTKEAWKGVYLEPAELAVIVLMKENDYYDTNTSLTEKLLPRVREAFHKKIDEAVFLGIDRPLVWGLDIASTAENAGNVITPSVGETVYSQIDRAMSAVEEDGYAVTGILGGVQLKHAFRTMLDTNGQPITGTEIDELTRNAILVENGAWDNTKATMIVGDFKQAYYSIREDISYKVLTEATITVGDTTYNLAQEDMIGIRFKMRIAFAIPNPVNAMNGDGATRFPFAVVKGSAGITTQTITFTVTNKESDEIDGAEISVGGYTVTTGDEGTATMKLQAGKYFYAVHKSGLPTTFGEFVVASSAVSVGVTVNA